MINATNEKQNNSNAVNTTERNERSKYRRRYAKFVSGKDT